MKKVLFIIIAMLWISQLVFSQETEKINTELKNEIKVNLFPVFWDIRYERFLSNTFSLGFSAGTLFYIDNRETDGGVYILPHIGPYCRYYYNILFVEANTPIAGSHMSLGLGIGLKFNPLLKNKHLIWELFYGEGHAFDGSKQGANCWRIGFTFGVKY